MSGYKERAMQFVDECLRLSERLDEALLQKINAPIPEEERFSSAEALKARWLTKIDGMALLLCKTGVITEEEMYELLDRCEQIKAAAEPDT